MKARNKNRKDGRSSGNDRESQVIDQSLMVNTLFQLFLFIISIWFSWFRDSERRDAKPKKDSRLVVIVIGSIRLEARR